jgi:Kef-type K+ transport system membrane component KefB
MSAFDLSVLFFLQAAIILGVCRLCAVAFVRLGQPPVVAEMIAGVLLGPSLLGLLAPEVSAYLFPAVSKPILFAVAQLGLVLYMFTVGLEFNAQHVRQKRKAAVAVSFAGIAMPFVLGAGLAYLIVDWPGLFSKRTNSAQAMLFLGAAMAITAFPMLARILAERGIAGSPLGTLALAAGATDDAIAWCVLALVLASFESDASLAVWAIGGTLAFAWVVLAVLRPWLAKLDLRSPDALRSPEGLSVTMAGLMLCAWFTDFIQIYAVFGAFILGCAMPRRAQAGQSSAADYLIGLVRPLSAAVLLPFFFTYSGLNTQLGLVNTPALWALTLGVVVIATLGKGVACYVAARATGQNHHDAASVGALMNARGLMELIILNIGLQRGLIEPTLFTIMVLMAIFTTLTATPIFDYIQRRVRHSLVVK